MTSPKAHPGCLRAHAPTLREKQMAAITDMLREAAAAVPPDALASHVLRVLADSIDAETARRAKADAIESAGQEEAVTCRNCGPVSYYKRNGVPRCLTCDGDMIELRPATRQAEGEGGGSTVTISASGTAHGQQGTPQGKNAGPSPEPSTTEGGGATSPNQEPTRTAASYSAAPASSEGAGAPAREGLRECPFCGPESNALTFDAQEGERPWQVICWNCGCETAKFATKDVAVATWNRRPSPPGQTAEVGTLVALLREAQNWAQQRGAKDGNVYPALTIREAADTIDALASLVERQRQEIARLNQEFGEANQMLNIATQQDEMHARDAVGWMEKAQRAEAALAAMEGRKVIALTEHEIRSGVDRVRHAEGLIRQLPATHDGRNTWLAWYGAKEKQDGG